MMNDERIMEILLDWNFWLKDLDTGIFRKKYIEKIEKLISTNFIISVIGIRRSGKSYILRQLVKTQPEKKNCLIINFEDERFPEALDTSVLDKIFRVYKDYIKPENKPLILLDEVHRVYGWEKWVRSIHELGKAKIMVTGSSSGLLSGNLSTLLTGRHLNVVVYPLSFQEFLDFNNLKFSNHLEFISNKNKILYFLKEYLNWGGFPEVVLTKEESLRKQILTTYFDDILSKDIITRYNITKVKELRSLAKYYLSNISSPITYRRVANFLNISVDTVKTYTEYLKEVFLIKELKNFSFSLKIQEKSPRKVYCIDPGLYNALGFKFSENIGRLMENLVYIELLRRSNEKPNMEIYYYKNNGYEIDFLIKEGPEVKELIQVTYGSSLDEINPREYRALIKASELFKKTKLTIITWDYEDQRTLEWWGKEALINFVPLWKWLL